MVCLLALGLILESFPATAQAAAPSAESTLSFPHKSGIAPPDFFGVVGRDPWYEWNTNPRYNGSNLEFLENMARDLKYMGARYIRIEFKADPQPGRRGGELNYAKYDPFINDIAPRYGLKVLGLLGYPIINWDNPENKDLHYKFYNNKPDQPDGTNPAMRLYTARAKEIIAHYGAKVATWEILNEFNYWEGVSLLPERMGTLMVNTYREGKAVNPKAQIIVGAQLALQKPAAPINAMDYLNDLYRSAPVQKYYKGLHTNPDLSGTFPWDGLAWHPYFTNVFDAVGSINEVLKAMRGWGDTSSKLWITEMGLQAPARPDIECGTSPEEQNQAAQLTDFFVQMTSAHLDNIAAIFWFKYEDFYDSRTGKVEPYGLVRLQTRSPAYYAPSGLPTRFKTGYYAYQKLAGPDLPLESVPAPPVVQSARNPGAPLYFKETGHTLSGPFLNYWQKNGGLRLFGLPWTEPFEELNPNDGKRYLVQYFERERFEYHPELAGTPYEVQLGLLGTDTLRFACKSYPAAPAPTSPLPPDKGYFQETGHYLSAGFKEYWEKRGGLAIFGYPLSEEITEISQNDGKPYTVQYFERARFEYHPEAPEEYKIQLALLGTENLKLRGWFQ
jgi:hypothetical protein